MSSLARSLDDVAGEIDACARLLRGRAALVGLSGIDASGKGYLAARLERMLEARGLRPAFIHVDGWVEHPDRRFDAARPAEHFYAHGLRLHDMFAQLVRPLRDQRSIRLSMVQFDSSNSGVAHPHTYDFQSVDVVLVEGIFIYKRVFQRLFDRRFWVDCTFETAMERALARNQESLSPNEIIRDYESIYFPAQRLHFERDEPRTSVHGRIINDHRMMHLATDVLAAREEAGAFTRMAAP